MNKTSCFYTSFHTLFWRGFSAPFFYLGKRENKRCESRGIDTNNEKIALIKDGGCAWFTEYATLDGVLVKARWCDTKYGSSLRAEMPDGSVVWTTALTDKGLARKGLKRVSCLRPAWFAFKSSAKGMLGVYTGSYVLFPSDYNYATGEAASDEPIEIKEWSPEW